MVNKERENALKEVAKLLELTVKQDLKGRKETVGKIDEIWDKFRDDEKISLSYAKSLFNLSLKQDLEGIKETVENIEKIWDKFKGDREISLNYAESLVNLSAEQDLEGNKETVGKIEEIWDKFKGDREISLAYAKSLVYLSLEQDLEGIKETVGKIEEIWNKFKDDREISLNYTGSLVNLTIKQDLEGNKETVGKIEEKWNKFKDDREISLNYVGSLVNLTAKQDLEGIKETVGKIEEIWDKFKGDREISLYYAGSLVNLTAKQDLEGIKETVGKIEEIWDKFGKDREISLQYAKSLFNLSFEKDIEGNKGTVGKIEEIWDKFKDDREISSYYAGSLVNLTMKQDLEGIKETVGKIEEIWDKFKGDSVISLNYANSLNNLFIKLSDFNKKNEILNKIKTVVDDHKEDQEIILRYSRNLDKIYKLGNASQRGELQLEFKSQKTIDIILSQIIGIHKDTEKDKIRLIELFYDIIQANSFKWEESDFWDLENIINIINEISTESVVNDERKGSSDKHIKEKLLSIYFVVKQIMHSLCVKDDTNIEKYSHYTSLAVLCNLLENPKNMMQKNEPKIRLYNVSYMNDPNEGKELFRFLKSDKQEEKTSAELIEKIEEDLSNRFLPSGIFFNCLSIKKDFLPMWNIYGKEGQGCSITFGDIFEYPINEINHSISPKMAGDNSDRAKLTFDEMLLRRSEYMKKNGIESKPNSENEESKKQMDYSTKKEEFKEKKESMFLYHVCYVNEEELSIPELSTGKQEIVKSKIKNLKKIIGELKVDEDKQDEVIKVVKLCLDKVRFLFKNASYQYEEEIRILTQLPFSSELIKADNANFKPIPRLYVEYPKKVKIKEVILGPRVENVEYIAPYLYYCDKGIVVKKSEIKFR